VLVVGGVFESGDEQVELVGEDRFRGSRVGRVDGSVEVWEGVSGHGVAEPLLVVLVVLGCVFLRWLQLDGAEDMTALPSYTVAVRVVTVGSDAVSGLAKRASSTGRSCRTEARRVTSAANGRRQG
jgi:hypothetical protein